MTTPRGGDAGTHITVVPQRRPRCIGREGSFAAVIGAWTSPNLSAGARDRPPPGPAAREGDELRRRECHDSADVRRPQRQDGRILVVEGLGCPVPAPHEVPARYLGGQTAVRLRLAIGTSASTTQGDPMS
jgi:hypothetical protein